MHLYKLKCFTAPVTHSQSNLSKSVYLNECKRRTNSSLFQSEGHPLSPHRLPVLQQQHHQPALECG